MFNFILEPIGWLMRQCYELTGHYALALFIFSLIIQVVIMFPFGIKQQKNTIKQAALRPKELAIRKKYKGRTDKATQMKQNQEIQEMYQSEGFNPLGGCLPLLIQMPVILLLYQIIIKPLTYLVSCGADIITNITIAYRTANELAETALVHESNLISYIIGIGQDAALQIEGMTTEVYNSIAGLETGFSFIGGTSLLEVPSFTLSWLLILPVLVYASSLFTTIVSQKFAPTSQDMQKTPMTGPLMKYGMPMIGVIFCFQLSGAIAVYWIFRSVLTIIQTFIVNLILPIPKVTQEQIAAAEAALKKKKKKKKVLLIEVDEDDDSYDSMVITEERAERIRTKNAKLAMEEAEEDKKLAELMSNKDEGSQDEPKDNDGKKD